MFSSSPSSSPLGNRGLSQHWRLHKPRLSSPLSPTSSSTQSTQFFRRRTYKSQGRGRTVSIPGITDTPQKNLLRDRFKAQCLEQAKENRAKAVRKGRYNSYKHGLSDDVFDTQGDVLMSNDEEHELLDDEVCLDTSLIENMLTTVPKDIQAGGFMRNTQSPVCPQSIF